MNMREMIFKGVSEGCSDHNCIITGKKTGMGTNGGCRCLLNLSRSQLHILQSRLAVILGSGKYALVPVEPTGGMVDAALATVDDDTIPEDEYVQTAYRAMIAAAQEGSE